MKGAEIRTGGIVVAVTVVMEYPIQMYVAMFVSPYESHRL